MSMDTENNSIPLYIFVANLYLNFRASQVYII